MINIQFLRNHVDIVIERLKKRQFNFDISFFKELEFQRKHIQIYTEELQNKRNQLSKSIGILNHKQQDVSCLKQEVIDISVKLKKAIVDLQSILVELENFLLTVPNLPHVSVPIGADENSNVEIRKIGIPGIFSFKPRDHVHIGIAFGLDLEAAVKLTGSRFVVMKDKIALLHRALVQFMLDVHTLEHNYIEHYTPYIVNSESLRCTGQLPKFKSDLFSLKKIIQHKEINSSALYLIPTAEVPLVNLLRNEIISYNELPLKFVAHSPCFRSEAGSYGRDTRGIVRLHQFDKIELVQIVHPDQSYEVLEQMLYHAEVILKKLNLPYRVLALCTGDISFSASKTYDIEVWMPAQCTYREVSSISNCEAFQARRMLARFRNQNGKLDLVHTLNGSALAVGRTLAAILENGQQSDGSVVIPSVLRRYMHGIEKL